MKLIRWSMRSARWHALRPGAVLLLAAAAGLQALMAAMPAAAEEPPRPTQRFLSTFPVSAAPAQYELVEQILDFPPGASTSTHTHAGKAFFTVVEGQITYREGDLVSVFGRGQSFTEPPGVFHTISNTGTAPARVFSSFLLSPGQAQLIAHPDSPAPAVAPRRTFLGRTTLRTQPGEFTLTQAVVDFAPGALQPWHHHGGHGLLMVIDGEVLFRTDAGAATLKPGDLYLDVDVPHEARNETARSATTVVTFLIRKGEPQTTFLTTVAAQPAPAIRPPAAGDAGLASR